MAVNSKGVKGIKLGVSTLFVFSRYITLSVVAVRGLFLASHLGPAIFAIYSLVILLQQQLSLTALGMREAITINLSGQSLEDNNYHETISTSINFTLLVAFILFLISVPSFIFRDYLTDFHPALEMLWVALIISGVTISNEVMTNIARLNGYIKKIAIAELSFALGTSLVALIVILSDYELIYLFLGILIISMLIFLFLFKTIFIRKISFFNKNKLKKLLGLGLPLMVVNVLTILTMTFGFWLVGAKEPLYDAGQYAFAAALASVISYGMNAYAWVYLAEVIGEFSSLDSVHEISLRIGMIRKYIILGFLLSSVGASLLYILIVNPMFPEYSDSSYIFLSLFIAQFFQVFAFPESSLLMAKKQIFSVLQATSLSFIFIISASLFFYNSDFELFNSLKPNVFIVSLIVLMGNFVYLFAFLFKSRIYKTSSSLLKDFKTLSLVLIFILIFFFMEFQNLNILFCFLCLSCILIFFKIEVMELVGHLKKSK